MKKIGFIDYYLYEFHANAYPNWINELSENFQDKFVVTAAWAEKDISPIDGKTSSEWTELTGITVYDSIEKVCEQCDYLIILSPDNPEKHLEYAKKVLPYGKITYIDKTFAPDYRTAKEIYELSIKYNAPIFSSSALRCADELASFNHDAKSVITTGGGVNLDRYIVHQLDMIVKLLGVDASRVMTLSNSGNKSIAIDYENGKAATLNFSKDFIFSASVEKDERTSYLPIGFGYFKNLIEQVLIFFDTGIAYVSKEEVLSVMALRDACLASTAAPFTFVNVTK